MIVVIRKTKPKNKLTNQKVYKQQGIGPLKQQHIKSERTFQIQDTSKKSDQLKIGRGDYGKSLNLN